MDESRCLGECDEVDMEVPAPTVAGEGAVDGSNFLGAMDPSNFFSSSVCSLNVH